jgi:protein TBF1
MREPDTEAGQEYSTVRSLFDHTKRVYSSKSPFLSPSELDLLDAPQVEVLRKANLATFVSCIFGSQEIGFAELNDNFLETFVPENGRLLKAHGSLFLDLKTQAFISSMHSPERSKTELLYTLFPDDIESKILIRRPGARGLAPSEQDFVKRTFSRRDILLADVNNPAALDALPEKYQWNDFLREISSYVSKNIDTLNTQPVSVHTGSSDIMCYADQVTSQMKLSKGRSTSEEAQGLAQEQLQSNFSVVPETPDEQASETPPKQEDFVAKAARAAQIALQGHNISIPAPGLPSAPLHSINRQSHHQPAQVQTNFRQYSPPSQSPRPAVPRIHHPLDYGPLPNLPHVSQTAPTQVLYERARQAATSKSSPASRRAGLPSQRRPWTTEEENALMAGLDRVRGPHWSQILAMFGPGGTINESLKDRNQVQLKDKARNLKLFFLKSGIEVPYYLKYVTGDLKSRAPGQASKNEARERERRQGEEDKAHFNGVQGIMALSGASQHSLQSPINADHGRDLVGDGDGDGGMMDGPGEGQVDEDGGDGDGDGDGPSAISELQDFPFASPTAGDGAGRHGLTDSSLDATLDPSLQGIAAMAKTELGGPI